MKWAAESLKSLPPPDNPVRAQEIDDARIEAEMIDKLVGLMRANDAPPEQYERKLIGLASWACP